LNNVLGVIASVSPTKMILTQCTIVNESNSNNITINVTALSFTGNGQPYGRVQNFAYFPTGLGPAIASGAAVTSVYDIYYAPEPTGAGHLSGAAVTSYTWQWVYVASGRMRLSGTVPVDQISVNYTGSGTMILSGTAQTQANRNYNGSGTAILSGAALTSFTAIFEYAPTNGIATLSGSALVEHSIVADVQGGTMIFIGDITYMSPGIYINHTSTDIFFLSLDNSINTVSGDFLAAGFLSGQVISISGSLLNNIPEAIILSVTTNEIVIDNATPIVDENDASLVTLIYASLTFLASDNSININIPGVNFITLRFAPGQYIQISGSVSNNVTGYIKTLSSTKMTLRGAVITNEADANVVTFTADEVITTYTRNFFYTASGTAHLSGTVIGNTEVNVVATVHSGPAHLQGAAAYQPFGLGYIYTSSGTAIISRSAVIEPILSDYVYRIAGGTMLSSGSAITHQLRNFIYISSGTAVTSGSAIIQPVLSDYIYRIAGGTILSSGSAIIQPVLSDYIYRIAGGTILSSGSAITSSP
jgi:hypothetical protein